MREAIENKKEDWPLIRLALAVFFLFIIVISCELSTKKQDEILEPIQYMQNKYQQHHSNLLPYSSYYSNKTMNKIKLQNNSAYIDGFFTYLTS